MSQYNSIKKLGSSNTAVRKLFANPVLIPGEHAADYRSFAKEVCATLDVQNIMEGILARGLIDCEWEIQRWRRVQTALLTPPAPDLLEIARVNLRQSDAYVQDRINRAFDKARGLEGLADMFVDHASAFEQVDRIIAALEVRRANALRELERYREEMKRRRRVASNDVIEAEYVEMPRKAA